MSLFLIHTVVRGIRRKARIFGGVLTGYAVMALVLFGLFSCAYFVLGAEGSFVDESWDISGAWIAVSISGGLVAAYVGGFVCRRVSQRLQGVWVLAGAIVILGIAMAQASSEATTVAERMTNPTLQDAMNNARQPVWIAYINPLLGAVGVLLGGHRKKVTPNV